MANGRGIVVGRGYAVRAIRKLYRNSKNRSSGGATANAAERFSHNRSPQLTQIMSSGSLQTIKEADTSRVFREMFLARIAGVIKDVEIILALIESCIE